MPSLLLTEILEFVAKEATRGDTDSVLRAIDRFAADSPHMLMHLGHEKGLLLDDVVSSNQPQRVLELGSYFGYSAIRMARLLRPIGRLITLESNSDHVLASRTLIEFCGLADCAQVVEGDAENSILSLSGPFDLVLIDHFASNYLNHLKLLESNGLLRAGSIIVADNVLMHAGECADYLAHVRDGDRYLSEMWEVDVSHHGGTTDAIEVSTYVGKESRLPEADTSTRKYFFEWLERFASFVRDVDYDGARPSFHPDVLAFGTHRDVISGLDTWVASQWDKVWPRTSDFYFDLQQVRILVSDDNSMASVVAPWTSTGYDRNGKSFPRPGRATMIFHQRNEAWLCTHSHMSLNRGVPQESFADRAPK